MSFCSKCGKELEGKPDVCPYCGEKFPKQNSSNSYQQPVIVNIENKNNNVNSNMNNGYGRRMKNKWIALLFWFFLGVIGGHKFYEERIGMGILYFFTFGLFGIGVVIDFWILLFKPTHYYVG